MPSPLARRRLIYGAQSFMQKVTNIVGASYLLRLWMLDEASGTTLTDYSPNKANKASAYTGITLGLPGPIAGHTSGSFDGTTSYVNAQTANLTGAFNPLECTIFQWVKMSPTAWTDGALRMLVRLSVDNDNMYWLYKSATNNYLNYFVKHGGSTLSWASMACNISGWFSHGLTLSKSGNVARQFINSSQVGSDVTVGGTWAGTPGTILLGASSMPSAVHDGLIGPTIIANRALSVAEMKSLFFLAPNLSTLSILGDSISAAILSWAFLLAYGGTYPRYLMNHAVSGQGIIANMDAQAASAASDNSNLIICALGTNDDNTGNMATLQAKVESNLASLKASNPSARIYYLNVLKRWTDVGGGTEFDKSNIRAAIAAACAAQGVTCWDTYTSTWIDAADTSDGLHPTAAGHAKIAAQVLARL